MPVLLPQQQLLLLLPPELQGLLLPPQPPQLLLQVWPPLQWQPLLSPADPQHCSAAMLQLAGCLAQAQPAALTLRPGCQCSSRCPGAVHELHHRRPVCG